MDFPTSSLEDNKATVLSVVVPLYNEQENIRELHRRLSETLERMRIRYEIVLVDDGSSDRTPDLLDEIQADDVNVVVIQLSRNFGHQPAVCAGIDVAVGAGVLVMDGDLQDPPESIADFVGMWRQGYDVVYAVRTKRKEALVKRLAYLAFYRLLKSISDVEIALDSGDFGLMDRKVIEALKALPERKRFVRGLRSFVGFRQVGLAYERDARAAGSSKYTLKKLVSLAIDGLVSFSSYPLRLVTYLGILTAAIAVGLTVWVLVSAFSERTTPQGWASTMVVVLFLGSIQLISLGIIGEYIRLIFWESKQRPTYIVSKIAGTRGRIVSDRERTPEETAGS